MKDTIVNLVTFVAVAILFFYAGAWIEANKIDNTYMTYVLNDTRDGKNIHDEFRGLVKDFKKCDALNHYE